MKILTRKIVGTPRHREGPPRRRGLPRRGHARLGKPGGRKEELFGLPRRGVDLLGEPVLLGGGRLCLGEPGDEILACYGLVAVGFMTRFVMFVASFRGLVRIVWKFHFLTKSDMLDVNMCALT